jgi:hypothetical protein
MQRLLSALVAIMSFSGMLLGMNAAPVTAQDRMPAENGRDGSVPVIADPAADPKPVVLPPGVTLENVEVKDRPLIIQGDMKGSIHAVNSRVTLMPGATIEGNLTVVGGSLSVATGRTGLISGVVPRGMGVSHQSMDGPNKGNWFGGQFCLWLLGLGGGLIVLLAAPNATSRVAETVSLQPGRSLVTGLVTAAGMFAALAVSGIIMKTFLALLWMPVLIAIVLVSLFLLVFGWLAGMRRVGDLLARKYGQTGSGTFYGRMVIGLSAFFIANALLGAINPTLGAAGLLVEFAIALMGIGAIVRTGFGKDEQWLDRQFRRSPGGSLG